jgi:serine phosphatase RsbU (regulator of sigma subunit)/CHASE2 domain-containing sensor protein
VGAPNDRPARAGEPRRRPWLAAARILFAASRRVAFWPALCAALLAWWGLHGQGAGLPPPLTAALGWLGPTRGLDPLSFPASAKAMLTLLALFAAWPVALAAGLWGGGVGWAAGWRQGSPERAAAAGVWGLWAALALLGALLLQPAWSSADGFWLLFQLALPLALVLGPGMASRLGLPAVDRLAALWGRRWVETRGFARGFRFGRDGQWDGRGLALGGLIGLLVALVTFLGVFDHLEASTLAARVRLRNEPIQLPGGTVEFWRWLGPHRNPKQLVAVLDLDDHTAAQILQRSSEFAVNRRLLAQLRAYGANLVVLPVTATPAAAAATTDGSRLHDLQPTYRYPPLEAAALKRLRADLPALAAALSGDPGAILALIPQASPAAGGEEELAWTIIYRTLWEQAARRGSAEIEPYLIRPLPSLRLDPPVWVGRPAAALAVPLLLARPDGPPPPLSVRGMTARFGPFTIPLAAPDRMLINVYGSAPGALFQHVSYASVLAGERIYDRQSRQWVEPATFFRGRWVFLDTLYQPVHETPVGTFKTCELLAMAADNIMRRSYLQPPPRGSCLLLLVCVGALAGHLALSHRPAAAALRLLAAFLVLLLAASLLFIASAVWVPVVPSMVAALAGYVVVTQVGYSSDQRELDEQRRERSALAQSLTISRAIQASLLPERDTTVGPFRIRSAFEPAQAVGGDFFNVFPLDDGRVALALGDVAGHGVQGAMYMTVATTLLEARADGSLHPSQVLADVNARLYPKIRRLRMFVSLFYGVLDPGTGRLVWAAAGQLPPVVIDAAGGSRFLSNQGAPLGAMAASQYRDAEYILAPGETLLMVSDGFVEARDAEGQALGYANFLAAAARVAAAGRDQLPENLMSWVKEACGQPAELDDLTLLAVHYQEVEAAAPPSAAAPAGIGVSCSDEIAPLPPGPA